MLSRSLIAIFTTLLLLTSSAFANVDKEGVEYTDTQFEKDERAAVRRASAAWETSINQRKPLVTVGLYDNDFYLYATLKNKIKSFDNLVEYFTVLSKKQDMNVKFDNQNIRVYGSVAVNSGLYTFSFTKDGKKVSIPARYTFVYLLTPEGWRIVDHHSSELPE